MMHSNCQRLTPLFFCVCMTLGYCCAATSLAIEQVGKNLPSDLGRRDLILLLPSGPTHVRLKVTDGQRSLEQLRSDYLDKLIARLDTNADGALSSDETRNHALFMTGRRFADSALAKSLPSAKGMNRSAVAQSVDRAIGQSMVFRQIGSVAEQDLQVFKALDEDDSGLVERDEMRTSPARLAARDLDHDYCITFDEFVTNPTASMMPDLVLQMNSLEPSAPVHSELLRDAKEPVMASRLIRIYDSDRDAKLSAEELHWAPERVQGLDQNKDGYLSVAELTKLADAEPDVAVEIETDSKPRETAVESRPGRVKLVSSRESTKVRMTDGGMIEITQPTTIISLNYRDRDPVEEALKNARDTFNSIDVDANGYMDRDEIATHPRFQRYLFDAMDADNDDRLFSKEMDEYVRGIAEPSATICQMTLFDSGNGYFQILDKNGDGRISIRELRKVETSLLEQAHGEVPELNPSQMPRYFKIEIQRGGPVPFSPVSRPRAEVPQPQLASFSGPIWFQRMDRNGDSDLVWDEFLGPRDVFDRIDKDKDGLIDPKEAENER